MSLPLASSPPQGRLLRWAKILSAYFTAQTLTQLLGIAAGLLFVNFMPVREYALYTLASSVITFFSFVTDLGSTTSLVHFYHRTAREGGDFRGYQGAVLSLRRLAFLLGAAGVVVLFPWTAMAKGFGTAEAALATVAILAGVGFQIPTSLRVLALRLEDRYARSYQAEMAGAALRLVLAGLLVAASWLQAWLAVLSSALGSALSFFVARPEPGEAAPADLKPYRRNVLRYLLPTLPSALYFSIQGPLMVWLAATFGATRTIAEVGALGRLGLLVGIFSSLTGVVFLPRLARITDDRLYLRRALQFGGLLVALVASLFLAAVLVPDLLLMLLGDNYSGLRRELPLALAGSGIAL
ncbi:MAG TPA: hypothetical protein VLE27_12705, partial [Thermoanaerobaculia bacterium]|nr:hypothetical protein [Thermoanaerobaculia bacterium]